MDRPYNIEPAERKVAVPDAIDTVRSVGDFLQSEVFQIFINFNYCYDVHF